MHLDSLVRLSQRAISFFMAPYRLARVEEDLRAAREELADLRADMRDVRADLGRLIGQSEVSGVWRSVTGSSSDGE